MSTYFRFSGGYVSHRDSSDPSTNALGRLKVAENPYTLLISAGWNVIAPIDTK